MSSKILIYDRIRMCMRMYGFDATKKRKKEKKKKEKKKTQNEFLTVLSCYFCWRLSKENLLLRQGR